MSPNEDVVFANDFYLVSNDNYYIKINSALFYNWDFLNNESKELRVNLSYQILNPCYSIISSIKILKLLPDEFPISFEEFFYFCEILGAPYDEKELLSNTILDHYKPGWNKFIKNNIYNRINHEKNDFYSYYILWAKLCDNIINFKDRSAIKLLFSNFTFLGLGILIGYFSSNLLIISC
jgi:hypothetical protein